MFESHLHMFYVTLVTTSILFYHVIHCYRFYHFEIIYRYKKIDSTIISHSKSYEYVNELCNSTCQFKVCMVIFWCELWKIWNKMKVTFRLLQIRHTSNINDVLNKVSLYRFVRYRYLILYTHARVVNISVVLVPCSRVLYSNFVDSSAQTLQMKETSKEQFKVNVFNIQEIGNVLSNF
uniref:Uncharacterized protein n=1 Tax=Cacopsylla melanoneura TaxID=428564 RepID=A0A8D8M6I1_9HEMI